MRPLLNELNRRNVTRVATAYALVGWIFIEAGSVLLPTFGAPEWVFKAWVILVVVGFVLSVIFAWVFELTPEGIKLERDVDRTQSITGQTGRKLNATIIALLVVALGISITFNVIDVRGGSQVADSSDHRSIAVLPFDSRSADPENAFFADGIHGDLLSTLANIGALKVISRTSVMEYRDSRKNLRDIADELGVGTVLEGAVQKAGENVRINVQLIDADTDQPLWSQTYDRALNTRNIFAIQSEISSEIARALQTQLTPAEQDRIAAVETDSLEAYNLVQAGRNSLDQRRYVTLQQARVQFEQAIGLDPNYAQAYVGLADALILLMVNHQALGEEEALDGAARALDSAMRINPNIADAHASKGLLLSTRWQRFREPGSEDAAEAEFRRAIDLNPNNVQAHMWYASLLDERGESRRAMELHERAIELDPLARIPRLNLAVIHAKLGEHDKAIDIWLSAVRLHPDWATPYQRIAIQLERTGRLDEAAAWAVRGWELTTDPLGGGNLVSIYLEMGLDEAAAGVLDAVPQDHPFRGLMSAAVMLVRFDYQGAYEGVERWIAESPTTPEFVYGIAYITAILAGDYERAREYLIAKSPALARGDIGELTNDTVGDAVALGFVLQTLGEDARANYLLEQALDAAGRLPRLGISGHGIVDVQALALLGRTDDAIAALESAVAEGLVGTSAFVFWRLKEDPMLQGLHGQPRFEAIATQLEAKVAAMRERVEAARASGNWEPLLSLAGSARIAAR